MKLSCLFIISLLSVSHAWNDGRDFLSCPFLHPQCLAQRMPSQYLLDEQESDRQDRCILTLCAVHDWMCQPCHPLRKISFHPGWTPAQGKSGVGASVAPRSLPSSEERPDVPGTSCPPRPREVRYQLSFPLHPTPLDKPRGLWPSV